MSIGSVLLALAYGFLLWGIYLAALALLPMTAYSFGRVAAKFLGHGNASVEEFPKQRRRLAACAATYAVLFIVFCVLMVLIRMTGTMEGPG